MMVAGAVSAAGPVPAFSGTPTVGPTPLTVAFTDASTGSPTGWAWFFGDEDYSAPWVQQTAGAAWPGRSMLTSVAMPDGSIVLMGGYSSAVMNDVWRSTDNGITWTQLTASAPWSARHGHGSVVLPDGSIVLMGGNAGVQYSNFNDVWRSTDNGVTWTQLTASAPWSARRDFASVAMPDGSIVLMGGFTDSEVRFNDVWRSTDNGATWTQQTASAPWQSRAVFSAVVMPDGSIVLMGGNYGPYGVLNDVWRSTDNGATWTQLTASAPWSARIGYGSVVMPDGSIVLMGGYSPDDGDTTDVWRSTDNGITWTQLTASPPWPGRSTFTSVAMPDGSIVLMAGYSRSISSNLNDVWRFQPAGSSARNPSHTYATPGMYNVALQASSAAGYSTLMKSRYVIATSPGAPPAVTGISPAQGPSDGGTTVTITGTGFTGATAVMFGTTPAFSGSASSAKTKGSAGKNIVVSSSGTSLTVTAPAHAAGPVHVTVTTPAGTSAATSADLYTYVDTPVVTGISPEKGPAAGGATVTITGSGFTGATRVYFGTKYSSSLTVVSDTLLTVKTPSHPAGMVDVTVRGPGGTSDTSAEYTFVVAPIVTGVSPAGGPVTGGTVVTVTGTGLSGATSVKFGTTPSFSLSGASVGSDAANGTNITVSASGTSLTVTAPPHSAGAVHVRVTTAGGTSAVTSADVFTYYPKPAVTAIDPAGGSTTGGAIVTLTGTGFTGATSVKFGDTPGTGVTVVSSTRITVNSPAHAAGTAYIRVTTPGGTSPTSYKNKFTYVTPGLSGSSPRNSYP